MCNSIRQALLKRVVTDQPIIVNGPDVVSGEGMHRVENWLCDTYGIGANLRDSVGCEWEVNRPPYYGKFTTRVWKYGKQNDVNIDKEALNNLVQPFVQRLSDVQIYPDFHLRWAQGDWGDHGSCYWGERRDDWHFLREHGFMALKFFNVVKKAQVGRCWVAFPDHYAVLFNAYGCSLGDAAAAVLSVLPREYTQCEVTARNVSHSIYLNDDVVVIHKGNAPSHVTLDTDPLMWCTFCGKEIKKSTPQLHPVVREPMCNECAGQSNLWFPLTRWNYEPDMRKLVKADSIEGFLCNICGYYHTRHHDCFDEGGGICCACDVRLNEDDIYSYHGDIYCESCFHDRYFYCDDCGEDYPNDEMCTNDWGTYCSSCAEDRGFCRNCNTVLRSDEAGVCRSCKRDGYHVCPDCDEATKDEHIEELCDSCYSKRYYTCDHCGEELEVDTECDCQEESEDERVES